MHKECRTYRYRACNKITALTTTLQVATILVAMAPKIFKLAT